MQGVLTSTWLTGILALRKLNIMKKIFFSGLAILISSRSSRLNKKKARSFTSEQYRCRCVTSDDRARENAIPRTRTDKFEVNFANGQMIIANKWKMR